MSDSYAGKRRRAVVLVATFVLMVASAIPATASEASDTVSVIVTFKPGVAAASNAATTANRHAADVKGVFTRALSGFVAEVPVDRVDDLAAEPHIASVEYDLPVQISGDPNLAVGESNGADRVNLEHLPGYLTGASVDGDIAIVDTGVSPHVDLNVAGGVDCTSGTCVTVTPTDPHGHGTHVAGTAAAYDDGIGVTGIAAGARIWSVRVLDENGSGYTSSIIAGLDWIAAHNGIEVANMSLSGLGSLGDAFQTAVQSTTATGVVIVAAAGNDSTDAAVYTPAAFPETITVSSITDSDGNPYGNGAPCNAGTPDDGFSAFSNYGSVVDIAAPGGCILSTYPGGGYASMSGTSMAAPHVAGAALRWIVTNNVVADANRTSTVRSAILTNWTVPAGDACGYTGTISGEPLLMLSPCDHTAPTMGAITATPDADEVAVSFAPATDTADIASYQLDYTERELIAGSAWTNLGTYSSVPTDPILHQGLSGPATIDYLLTALDWEGNTATITASAEIADNSGPTLTAPSASVDGQTVTLAWTAATDPSGVNRIELWQTVDEGTLTLYQTLAADASGYTDSDLEGGHTYRYQLKGYDTLGNITTTTETTADVAVPAPAPAPGGGGGGEVPPAPSEPEDPAEEAIYDGFADVAETSRFADDIRWLTSQGITVGCGSEMFCPTGAVTRGEMAVFLTRALGLESGSMSFIDVVGHPYEEAIASIADAGISIGIDDARFDPESPVTRGQMAVFIARALQLPAGTATFIDAVGHPYADAIASIADAGITLGVGDGKFDPNAPITREQMAAFLRRALDA